MKYKRKISSWRQNLIWKACLIKVLPCRKIYLFLDLENAQKCWGEDPDCIILHSCVRAGLAIAEQFRGMIPTDHQRVPEDNDDSEAEEAKEDTE